MISKPDVRLVTLMGPGGTGKTRLSLQVAQEMLNDFPDGVFFVPLADDRKTINLSRGSRSNFQSVKAGAQCSKI